jgi:uncharacterized membrane protein
MASRWSIRVVWRTVAAVGVGALALPLGASAAHADTAFVVTTAYPTVETQPGSSVKLDLAVSAAVPDVVNLDVGGVPEGWNATLRGGGFVIHAITAEPTTPATATLEVAVPATAAEGSYPITLTGQDGGGGTSSLVVTVDVAAQVDNGVELTADFPSLRGDPATDFAYTLTITNNTPEQQTFTFSPTAPEGWTVTASPTAEARAETATVDAGGTGQVKVTATPPDTTAEGSYPIDVDVVAANGAKGHIGLTAQVTGTPKLTLTTADQRLDASGRAGHEKRIPLILSNSGTAEVDDVKLAGTAPTGWNVSFDPQDVASLKPNETAQVTAILKPASGAVAGDYALTIRSSAGSQSSNIDVRFSLTGARSLGYIAIAVIVIALAALGGVFWRFGRR